MNEGILFKIIKNPSSALSSRFKLYYTIDKNNNNPKDIKIIILNYVIFL